MQPAVSQPARQWTPAQDEAIHTNSTSLLVSAAAGSGKTSVLAERCVHLLCDANPSCEVSELLVVTFTEAAAAEMKARIARSLSDRHRQSPSDATAKHLAMLDRASISTLHGFCARVLRQNFHLMGLDPEFRILDADEASLLKLDIARDLFDERYDDENGGDFRNMIDCYAEGQDDRLIRQVIRAYDTLCSVVDPAGWLHHARHRIEQAIDLPMEKSELGQAYARIIRSELNSLLRECAAAANAIKQLKRFEMYVAHLRELWTVLKHWLSVLDSHGLDALAEESSTVELPALPRVASSIEGKDLAKSLVDSVREAMKTGSWRKNLLFTTDEWKQGLSLTLPHVDVFLSLVADFSEKFTQAKNEEGLVDFADLELLTLRSLKLEGVDPIAPSPLARSFHHQFQHVLVDEYQDINEVQDAILSLVSRECLKGGGNLPANLFCVGDVKQSIYRFRLAEAAQFLHRRDSYSQPNSHGKVIDLQTNFRSRAPLVEAINGIFSRLMTKDAADLDYDDSQKLTPGQTFPEIENGFHGSPIELHLLPKDATGSAESEDEEADLDRTQREAVLLGHRILEMLGRTGKPAMQIADRSGSSVTSRPLRFGDIVLLLRSMRFKADPFAATLRQMGVPVHAESVTGYFEATEVNDVLSLLHVLDNQQQDIHLAALLRSPIANLPNPETSLAKIRIAYSGEPAVPFHLAVQKYAQEQTDELATFLRQFSTQLQTWRQDIRQQPIADMLWKIYDQTGYLGYVAGLPNGQQRQANLIELHDRARQFGTFQRQGLARFLTFLEKLKAETDLGQASIASEAEDVVRIMSIHRSKGQEFPVVLLPDLGKAINLQDCRGTILLDRAAGLGLSVIDDIRQIRYPSLASTVVAQRLKQQAMAEELRVLYVAMTRAKEHLILAGTVTEKQIEKWKQWANHKGPIPAETVLAARSPVDWIGPVTAAIPDQFDVQAHTLETLSQWFADQPAANQLTPAQAQLANLQPLDPPPPMTAEATAIIEQLSDRYAHKSTLDLAAAASVTSLVKGKNAVAETRSSLPSKSLDRVLSQPTFLAGRLPPDAADIGTATHAVLEHFDYTDASGPDAVPRQLARLVQTRRLTAEQSAIVDIPAIEWFLSSDLGKLIQENAAALQRELPVNYANGAEATESTDPCDLQMIRGRIDLMLPRGDGWMIVDYKTDRVTDAALEQRAEIYAGQLNQYRDAIRKITGKPVVESALVFLHPREIRKV
jgi:ATP-dependent helicase/nuclease subunit A